MFHAAVNDIMQTLRLTQSCPDADLLAQPQTIGQRRDRAYSTELTHTNHGGIAAWDNKRQKCHNCKHIYLKSLSPTAGFCSMDCKSNAMYLYAMSEKIKCVKESIVAQPSAPKAAPEVVVQAPIKADEDDVCFESEIEPEDESSVMGSYCPPSTFAEFHTQKLKCRPVEWSFSALY
ncbi:hypothetical protein DYB25_004856 [Aphanomyces astaci]|uniref:Uncharacterized protein n=1 Tax=Aphanomyces astaci TaxID=112090 RepID=A0A397EVN9_APHAT|nr:hypothetical protein DYB25_004856 [Aphanomyces astaci]RHY39491.1 hypothetical protein DYB30_003925 [Aphanomyces astaci]RHY42819.1 hypothetical protein DYB34_005615 [Aphanomyces astaci]RHZ07437.1 hypothetical protein DYB31_003753 [Aphanomyces astaci]RHZ31514.1 hypothetical protein DYB26_004289 [Aphanomyces astaci]